MTVCLARPFHHQGPDAHCATPAPYRAPLSRAGQNSPPRVVPAPPLGPGPRPPSDSLRAAPVIERLDHHHEHATDRSLRRLRPAPRCQHSANQSCLPWTPARAPSRHPHRRTRPAGRRIDSALQQILAAYTVLGDLDRRTGYDRRPGPTPRRATRPNLPVYRTQDDPNLDPPIQAGPVRWHARYRPQAEGPADGSVVLKSGWVRWVGGRLGTGSGGC